MALKKMSVKDYAEARNISPQAVVKALNKGHRTPGIIDAILFCGTYELTVDTTKLKNFLVANNKPAKLAAQR